MKCPVCKGSTGFYQWPAVNPEDPDDILPYSLCQRSYVVNPREGIITCSGSPPISPRCQKCYDKAVKRADRRETREKSPKKFQKTVPAVPAPVCASCFHPLGIDADLTDFGRLTELVLKNCATCLRKLNAAVNDYLHAEPDYANALVGSGYAIGVNCPRVLAIPMKKRPEHPARALLRIKRLWRNVLFP